MTSFKDKWTIKGSMQNKWHKYIYIYIQRVKTIWKIYLKNELTYQTVGKWNDFSDMSPLSLQTYAYSCLYPKTNHTYTSLNSLEGYFSPIRFIFPHWAHDGFIRGGKCRRLFILYTVQEYFWHAWQWSDVIPVMRPDHWVGSEMLKLNSISYLGIWGGWATTSSPHRPCVPT